MKTTEKLMNRWLAQPLGSLNKRELELLLLGVLIEDGYLPSQAAPLARKARITLTKAHGYLTDLALRQPVMADQVALNKLVGLLKTAEVVQDGEALQFTVQDAVLRLWIENGLAQAHLLQGESLRRDVIKLSGRALAVLLSGHPSLPKPAQAVKQLKQSFGDADWFDAFAKQAKPGVAWDKVLGVTANAASVVKAVAEGLVTL